MVSVSSLVWRGHPAGATSVTGVHSSVAESIDKDGRSTTVVIYSTMLLLLLRLSGKYRNPCCKVFSYNGAAVTTVLAIELTDGRTSRSIGHIWTIDAPSCQTLMPIRQFASLRVRSFIVKPCPHTHVGACYKVVCYKVSPCDFVACYDL